MKVLHLKHLFIIRKNGSHSLSELKSSRKYEYHNWKYGYSNQIM